MTPPPRGPSPRGGPGDARLASVRRRFVVLNALRWLPTGLLIPITAVFMQSRGLSLAEIGLVMAVGSGVVLALELPTGGLADALGRRPVLLLASALDIGSLALLLTAHSPGAFMLAGAVQGVFRALESGPLEAWYVDTSLAIDHRAAIERGLARGGVAIGLAISVGALTAAGLTARPPIGGVDPLVVPVVAALVLRVVDIGALALLVTEGRARLDLAMARTSVAAAPGVVRSTVRLVSGNRALLALVGVELLWGAGLVAVELFSGPRMVELLGDPERGVAVFGLAAAAGWSISAVGSAATGRLTALLGGGPGRVGAVLRVVQGSAVAVMAVGGGPLGLVTGYLAFYLVHGSANVVHYGMVHRLVDADHRTTVISANSLAGRLGAIAGTAGLGALATAVGIPVALAVAAGVLAAAAPLYRAAGRPRHRRRSLKENWAIGALLLQRRERVRPTVARPPCRRSSGATLLRRQPIGTVLVRPEPPLGLGLVAGGLVEQLVDLLLVPVDLLAEPVVDGAVGRLRDLVARPLLVFRLLVCGHAVLLPGQGVVTHAGGVREHAIALRRRARPRPRSRGRRASSAARLDSVPSHDHRGT